jgi:hypothetical protein
VLVRDRSRPAENMGGLYGATRVRIERHLSDALHPFLAGCLRRITERTSLINNSRWRERGTKVAKYCARCLIPIVSRGNLRPPEVPEALLPGGAVQCRSARFHSNAPLRATTTLHECLKTPDAIYQIRRKSVECAQGVARRACSGRSGLASVPRGVET